MRQIDLFGGPASSSVSKEIEDLLATSAAHTIIANMPCVEEGSPWWHRIMVNVEGSGPGYDVPSGSTFKCWWRIRELLNEAWRDEPRRDRPTILSMKLPAIDYDHRQWIYWLAEQRQFGRTELKPGRFAGKAVLRYYRARSAA